MSLPAAFCFGCSKHISTLYASFDLLKEDGYTDNDVLDILRLDRMCCRNSVLTGNIDFVTPLLAHRKERGFTGPISGEMPEGLVSRAIPKSIQREAIFHLCQGQCRIYDTRSELEEKYKYWSLQTSPQYELAVSTMDGSLVKWPIRSRVMALIQFFTAYHTKGEEEIALYITNTDGKELLALLDLFPDVSYIVYSSKKQHKDTLDTPSITYNKKRLLSTDIEGQELSSANFTYLIHFDTQGNDPSTSLTLEDRNDAKAAQIDDLKATIAAIEATAYIVLYDPPCQGNQYEHSRFFKDAVYSFPQWDGHNSTHLFAYFSLDTKNRFIKIPMEVYNKQMQYHNGNILYTSFSQYGNFPDKGLDTCYFCTYELSTLITYIRDYQKSKKVIAEILKEAVELSPHISTLISNKSSLADPPFEEQ